MKKILLTLLFMFSILDLPAQFSKLDRDLYLSQIHLVDEFMDRFNGKSHMPNLPKELLNDRKNQILLLFDLGIFESREDSLFIEAEKFAQKVINDSIRLHYEDSTWYAKALCEGTLNKKPVEFTLYLRVDTTATGVYTWFVSGAEGNAFKIDSLKDHKPFTLMPDDHETNFMSLYRMTDETFDYITDFISDKIDINQTTVFITLVKLNLLKIEYVKDLEFVFNQVPGYRFTIKYASREKLNAGWLINSFTELEN